MIRGKRSDSVCQSLNTLSHDTNQSINQSSNQSSKEEPHPMHAQTRLSFDTLNYTPPHIPCLFLILHHLPYVCQRWTSSGTLVLSSMASRHKTLPSRPFSAPSPMPVAVAIEPCHQHPDNFQSVLA
jgi:hypothetical protein